MLTIAQTLFLRTQNILNVLLQVSITGIMAVGMTFVIITAGIDLSVASILALSSIVAAYFAKMPNTEFFIPLLMVTIFGGLC